ncbi:hypothetical protein PRUPE_6G308900 [Prunus persica]|uniref:Alcohol dehydrogenase-like N-terminal domain-containing protein n=1 Tax=Prunus persica TaxID=3760 RepID=M5WSC7_PRUPE|nr:hypothetical protein PRUPE_6G308900 [Prunus persica]
MAVTPRGCGCDSKYPVVPGHEIAGIVKEVGSNVQRFKVGDHMGVGTHVNSCRDCEYCNDSFNGVDVDGTIAKGGYSSHIVVHEGYCFSIPENYPLASAAPLLCAGITVYASMVRHMMNQHGHMAVKFGKTFGLNVTIFSTSISKKEEALWSQKIVEMMAHPIGLALVKSVDFIIDIASGDYPFDPYMELLKLVEFWSCMKTFSGSVTGGTNDIQEMIDFFASNGIHPMIEIIPIQSANEAVERLLKNVVIYGFVIDIENSLK